jgi:Helix-turn-helix domain
VKGAELPIILEPLIERNELARRLGVSPSCIRKWQRLRRIPSYKFGRRCVRYDHREVVATLEKFKAPAFQRFKRQRPRVPFQEPARTVQAEFSFRDPRQLDLALQDCANLPPA